MPPNSPVTTKWAIPSGTAAIRAHLPNVTSSSHLGWLPLLELSAAARTVDIGLI